MSLAQYYDLIFANKQYGEEANALVSLYRDRNGQAPATIFDIGCGTGSHALALEARGARVWATDTDADMLAVARAKGVTTGLPPENVDMTVAMFNVVNYVPEHGLALAGLDALFALAYEHLRPGGMFAFDCWNADLAYVHATGGADPPGNWTYTFETGGYHLERNAYPQFSARTERVSVRNETSIFRQDNGELETAFSWRYTHRLWKSAMLTDRLRAAGFTEQQPPRQWGRRGLLFVAVKP